MHLVASLTRILITRRVPKTRESIINPIFIGFMESDRATPCRPALTEERGEGVVRSVALQVEVSSS